MSLRLVLSVAAFIAASSTTLAAEPPTPPWQSPEFQEHPLVGQIIDVDTGEQLPVDTVLKRAAKARFLILGERHDNPDHHSIQAWVMEQMVERGRRPALVYEMLEADEQDTINNWRADNPPTPPNSALP